MNTMAVDKFAGVIDGPQMGDGHLMIRIKPGTPLTFVLDVKGAEFTDTILVPLGGATQPAYRLAMAKGTYILNFVHDSKVFITWEPSCMQP